MQKSDLYALKLEGAIKEVWSFETTFYVNIELRKYNQLKLISLYIYYALQGHQTLFEPVHIRAGLL